jgi:hypothetical protein
VGHEDNEFDQDPARARPDDTYWQTGATFQPTDRPFPEGYVGDWFFGTTYVGSIRRQLRDGRLFADYAEELRTVNEHDDLRPLRDEFGDAIFDPETGQPVFELPDVRSGVYLCKRFSAGASIRRAKTNWGVGVFGNLRVEESTFADDRDREDTLWATLMGVRRDLGQRTSASPSTTRTASVTPTKRPESIASTE